MTVTRYLSVALLLGAIGCQPGAPVAGPSSATPPAAASSPEAEMAAETIDPAVIRSEMAKLDEADRTRAMAQGYCVVSKEPLGSMGIPIKVSIADGRSLFVCCKGCSELVESKPDEMFARLPELEERTKREKPAGEEPAAATTTPPTEAAAPTEPAAAPQ
jgi:hypothetical protein